MKSSIKKLKGLLKNLPKFHLLPNFHPADNVELAARVKSLTAHLKDAHLPSPSRCAHRDRIFQLSPDVATVSFSPEVCAFGRVDSPRYLLPDQLFAVLADQPRASLTSST